MKKYLSIALIGLVAACNAPENNTETENESTNEAMTDRDAATTDAVRNGDAADQSAYDLPGEDTAAIHQNTTEPGVLEKNADRSREDDDNSQNQ